MRNHLPISLALAAALFTGCGTDDSNRFSSGPTPPSGTIDANGIYNGFILGRVKLDAALQPGPVQLLDTSGRVLYTVQANQHGFFHFIGSLPPDFRVIARRGSDTFQNEWRGGWRGGTLYVNVGTTLACAYLRAHPGLSLEDAEAKLRAYYQLRPEFRLSWFSVIRTPGFDTKKFLTAARAAGLEGYLNTLVARIDSGITAKEESLVGTLIEKASEGIFGAAVNDAAGSVVSKMGDNFTTAGALSNIESALSQVSDQIEALNTAFANQTAYANLNSRLQPLAVNATNLNASMVNITNTVAAYQSTHPNASDYQVPSSYPDINTVIGQINSLNVQEMSNPIVANITQTDSTGLYRALVNEQMTRLHQQGDTSFNGYPWRFNDLTEQQMNMMGGLITALNQAAYLTAEYANLQTANLASAVTLAGGQVNDLALDVQKAAQQVPDLLPSDELILDPAGQVMWYRFVLDQMTADDAKNFCYNLELGPYNDFGLPSYGALNGVIQKRILPATQNPPLGTGTTWADSDASNWQAAFSLMGINASDYGPIEYTSVDHLGEYDNAGFWYDNDGFSSSPGNNHDVNLYYITGTDNLASSNPSTDGNTSGRKINTLVCRIYAGIAGSPEYSAPSGVTAPDWLTYDDTAESFVGSTVSPFSCTIPASNPSISLVNTTSTNPLGAGRNVVIGSQLKATMTFNVSSYPGSLWAAGNGGSHYDVTQRVYWTSSNPAVASVSNLVGDTGSGPISPGPAGFVTWHPDLTNSGTPLPPVTITASLLGASSLSGASSKIWQGTYVMNQPNNVEPALKELYVTPQNRVYNFTSGNAQSALLPITLLAYHQDGRVFDVSTDPATTWTLKDADGNTLNSLSTGGFGVTAGSAKNLLYLSTGISTANVTYTANYNVHAGSGSVSGTMQIIKAGPVVDSLLPTRGPVGGGQSVIVRGSNFTNPSSVTIGGRAATTYFVTPTQLRVVTPPGTAGAAQVTVYTSASQSDGNSYYYYEN